LKIDDEQQYELLDSLIKQVHDTISSLRSDKDMELIHKINQLESVVSSVAKHLNEPDLIKDLREKESNKKFWATVDLQVLVRSRMKQAYEAMKSRSQ
jgi:vacuolar-type H+-ATPase subunit E/Vma4